MKNEIANLLRVLAALLESDHCNVTDDDLVPMRKFIYSSLDVYVDYKTIAEVKNKSINAVRSESCRKGWKKKYEKIKVSLSDALM